MLLAFPIAISKTPSKTTVAIINPVMGELLLRAIANSLISVIFAAWTIAIAIVSVQNATVTVSVGLLGLQSLALPIGLVLAFFAAVGFIGGAIFPLAWQYSRKKKRF